MKSINFFQSNSNFLLKSVTLYSLLICLFFASCDKKETNDENNDFYLVGQDTIQLNIPQDTIGITIKEGIKKEELSKVLITENLELVRDIQNQIFIVTSSKKQNFKRKDINKISEILREKYKGTIAQAGYLAYPEEGKQPMVVTDECVIDFQDDMTKEEIEDFLNNNGLEISMQNPFIKSQYLVRVSQRSQMDALQISRALSEEKNIKYMHPNFIIAKDYRVIPNDPLFNNQWHHRNTGQNAGTVDADIDTDLAWDITLGNPNIVIAVIDNGFDMTHPDIIPNFSINTAEIAGNGVDDDANGFVDDRIGWDFDGCGALPCGDNQPDIGTNFANPNNPGYHGTAVIGVSSASGQNNLGVIGSCPQCSVIPIEDGGSVWADGLAFGYAQARGARIISCSWGYSIGTAATMNVVTAINNVAAGGVTVFFAMNNVNVNDCGAVPDISSLPSVIGISRATNNDRFDLSGFGNCMDLLAPTRSTIRGTLGITTTDVQGNNGYNSAANTCTGTLVQQTPPPANARDYTNCFGGTSSATPLTAGVAGLMLSVNNGLTPNQIQNILQDCADKIEHSQGQYSPINGFSTPATGTATHGYGRVNAFEAVRVAAPVSQGGRGGVDIFLRDNNLDWGNTEQPSYTLFEQARGFIAHYQSVDIKVDAGPSYQTIPTNNAQFESLTDERPVSGETNKVYVRVRNRGFTTANNVTVKLHWVFAGLTFPNLPSDFWTRFPGNASDVSIWKPLGTQPITNLRYSGASVAGTGGDNAQIVSFDFIAPVHDASLPNHYCLMAMIDSPQDPISTNSRATSNMDVITPNDNNVTHRNITIENSSRSRDFTEAFFISNPYQRYDTIRVEVELSKGWKAKLNDYEIGQSIVLKPFENRLMKMEFFSPEVGQEGFAHVQQVKDEWVLDFGNSSNQDLTHGNQTQVKKKKVKKVLGGINFVFKNLEKEK